jgi:hypothetical protein
MGREQRIEGQPRPRASLPVGEPHRAAGEIPQRFDSQEISRRNDQALAAVGEMQQP